MPAASTLPPTQQQPSARHSLRRLAKYRILSSSNHKRLLQQQKSAEKESVDQEDSIFFFPSTSTANIFQTKQNEAEVIPIEKVLKEAESSMRLNLSWRKIKEFSSNLIEKFNLSDTLFLDLSGNSLKNLPEFLIKLEQLKTLIVQRNGLSGCLSPVIQSLSTLTYIDLSGNFLNDLPEEFYEHLQFLQVLILSGNLLTKLDSKIYHLDKCLQELDVSSNQLKSVPVEIGLLKALRVLNLSDNQLTELSPEIGKMDWLSIFNVSRNCLTSLPVEFQFLAGCMRSCITINISENPLISPPLNVVRKGRLHIAKWLKKLAGGETNHSEEFYENAELFYKQNYTKSPDFTFEKFSNISKSHFEENKLNVCAPLIINTTPNETTSNGSVATTASGSSVSGLTSTTSFGSATVCGTDSGYASTVDEYRFSHEFPSVSCGIGNSLAEIDELDLVDVQRQAIKCNKTQSTETAKSTNCQNLSEQKLNKLKDEKFVTSDLATEVMLAYAAEEQYLSQAFDEKLKTSKQQKKDNNNNENGSCRVDSNNNSKVESKVGIVNKSDDNVCTTNFGFQLNKKEATKRSDGEQKSNRESSLLGFSESLDTNNNNLTIQTLPPLAERNEKLPPIANGISQGNSFQPRTVSSTETVSQNTVTKTLIISSNESATELKGKVVESETPKKLNKTENCGRKMSLNDEIEAEHEKRIAAKIASNANEKPQLENLNFPKEKLAPKASICVSLTDDDSQSCASMSSSIVEEKNDAKSASKPTEANVAKSVQKPLGKAVEIGFASKLVVSSSTLPRKKIATVSAASKPKSISSSTSASNENVAKLVSSKAIASSTMNLSSGNQNSRTLRRPTPTQKLSFGLPAKKSATDVTTLTHLKSNRLGAVANIKTTAQTKTICANKTTAPSGSGVPTISKPSLSSMPIKASIPKQFSKSVTSATQRNSQSTTTNKKDSVAVGNPIPRSVRGLSSAPRVIPFQTHTKTARASIKQKAMSTINLAATNNKTETQIQGDRPEALSHVATMCKLIKNVLLDVKLDTNDLDALSSNLSNGILLCRFVNQLRPRTIPNILTFLPGQLSLPQAPKARRNVENFLVACRRLGVPDSILCINASSIVSDCRQILTQLAQIVIFLHNNLKKV